MGLIALNCTKCGARLEVDDGTSTYTCKYCQTVHERDYSNGASPTPYSLHVMAKRALANGENGKALQFVEQGLLIDPHHAELLALEIEARKGLASLATESSGTNSNLVEAEQYHLQAQFVLNELHINMQVYGSNSTLTGATPANVDLGLQYIDRSLELFPDNAAYLNLKALLLWEGKGCKDAAAELLEKASQINPRDINIQNNLNELNKLISFQNNLINQINQRKSKSSGCFVATAAFGSPSVFEVDVLRRWRDRNLVQTSFGRSFVAVYYRISPPLARFIETRTTLKQAIRWVLARFVKSLARKHPNLLE